MKSGRDDRLLAANGEPTNSPDDRIGLLARRARQYVLLNKWDFGEENRNPQRSVSRMEASPRGRAMSSTLPRASSNGNGSGNNGIAAYAARGSR